MGQVELSNLNGDRVDPLLKVGTYNCSKGINIVYRAGKFLAVSGGVNPTISFNLSIEYDDDGTGSRKPDYMSPDNDAVFSFSISVPNDGYTQQYQERADQAGEFFVEANSSEVGGTISGYFDELSLVAGCVYPYNSTNKPECNLNPIVVSGSFRGEIYRK